VHGFESPLGEALPPVDGLVVSPGWGRLVPSALEEGESVTVGTVIGHLREAGEMIPLVSHLTGAFVRWLALTGERVPPGRPLAMISRTST